MDLSDGSEMTEPEEFRPWPLQWKPEHVARFWDWYSSRGESSERYFSRTVGGRVLAAATRAAPIEGPAVEVGAAGGHFVDQLLGRGVDTLAIDSSPESVALLDRRLVGHPHFLGARLNQSMELPLDDGYAATLFLLETLEHLNDDTLDHILKEARRVLRPGGSLVVTTPNEEELARNQAMCPDCGCVFHTVQHVQSFSAARLSNLLGDHGFQVRSCRETLFSYMPFGMRTAHRVFWRLRRGKLPHLFYAGVRAQ